MRMALWRCYARSAMTFVHQITPSQLDSCRSIALRTSRTSRSRESPSACWLARSTRSSRSRMRGSIVRSTPTPDLQIASATAGWRSGSTWIAAPSTSGLGTSVFEYWTQAVSRLLFRCRIDGRPVLTDKPPTNRSVGGIVGGSVLESDQTRDPESGPLEPETPANNAVLRGLWTLEDLPGSTALPIGETGFEPATARPPGAQARCRVGPGPAIPAPVAA